MYNMRTIYTRSRHRPILTNPLEKE